MTRIPVTVQAHILATIQDLRDYVAEAHTPAPSLHPRVNGDDSWGPSGRWCGWNKTACSGVDLNGHHIGIEATHYANGGRTVYTIHVNGRQGLHSSGDDAFRGIAFPVVAHPPVSVILHPEHTPPSDSSEAILTEP